MDLNHRPRRYKRRALTTELCALIRLNTIASYSLFINFSSNPSTGSNGFTPSGVEELITGQLSINKKSPTCREIFWIRPEQQNHYPYKIGGWPQP